MHTWLPQNEWLNAWGQLLSRCRRNSHILSSFLLVLFRGFRLCLQRCESIFASPRHEAPHCIQAALELV